MPSEALKSMAEKHGVSMADAERYWDEAINSKGAKEADNKYAYAMGIVKKRMGVSSAVAADLAAAFITDEEKVTEMKQIKANVQKRLETAYEDGEASFTTYVVTCNEKGANIEMFDNEEYLVEVARVGTDEQFPYVDARNIGDIDVSVVCKALSRKDVTIKTTGNHVVKMSKVVKEARGKSATVSVKQGYMLLSVDGTPIAKAYVGGQFYIEERAARTK